MSSFGYGAAHAIRKALFGVALCMGGIAHADELVIAALGDSLTQGYGLPADQGFVVQLEAWLSAQGKSVRLINAGVSGDTTAGGLARAAWTLTPDVGGMILALGGNDLLRGLPPAQARDNLAGVMQAAQDAGVDVLLVGIQAPGNYGPAYKAEFDAIYPALAETFESGYMASFFLGLTGGAALDPSHVQTFFQADGIHPNADGVALIVEGFGPYVLDLITKMETE